MNKQQVNWARQHDWFLSEVYDSEDGEYSVYVRNDMDSEEPLDSFQCYTELRNWAGY